MTSSIVLAMQCIRVAVTNGKILTTTYDPRKIASGFRTGTIRTNKGDEAPKGACRPLSASPRQVYAVCANHLPMRKRSQRGPLASRRSAAALAPATERQDSAQAALHAKHDAKALPSPRIALKRCTSRPGRSARGRCPDRPGTGVTSPRPQEPHSLRQSASPVDVP